MQVLGQMVKELGAVLQGDRQLIIRTSLIGVMAKSFPSPTLTERHKLLGKWYRAGCNIYSCDAHGDASSSGSLSESAHIPSTKSATTTTKSVSVSGRKLLTAPLENDVVYQQSFINSRYISPSEHVMRDQHTKEKQLYS